MLSGRLSSRLEVMASGLPGTLCAIPGKPLPLPLILLPTTPRPGGGPELYLQSPGLLFCIVSLVVLLSYDMWFCLLGGAVRTSRKQETSACGLLHSCGRMCTVQTQTIIF